MEYEKKYFGNGTGNFDDADFILQPNQWVNMENCRVGSTDKGVVGTVESVGSSILLSEPEPSITFVQIGAVDYPEQRQILYFLKNLHGPWDRIVCYDIAADTFYNVLFSAQVTGGLNFDKNSLIHSARIVNGLLYWTDNLNQPRRINIKAGINMNQPGTYPDVEAYTAPVAAELITIIRKPPGLPLQFVKITDVDIDTNLIKNNAFRFSYRLTYREGELSTLAPHSLLAPYNFIDDEYNAILVIVPSAQKIDQDVQKVELVVFYADGGNAFIIKTWDKASAADAQEIEDHNDGVQPLEFVFANDSVGEALDAAYRVKPFDSVPLLSEALEQATNRIFLGRNLLGYDTPLVSSLAISVYEYTPGGGSVTGNWIIMSANVSYPDPPPDDFILYDFYFAYFAVPVDGDHPAGLYIKSSGTDVTPLPTNIDINDYDYVGSSVDDAYDWVNNIGVNWTPEPGYIGIFLIGPDDTGLDVDTSSSGITSGITILKSDSPYGVAVVFYDQYMRQCGVTQGLKIRTPDREYSTSSVYDYGIQWNLDIGAQPDEIPDWAYFYMPVLTKSLRTSFFVQARAGDIVYATKDSDGNYLFTSTTFAVSNAGVALKLDILEGYGMGYVFNEGDVIKVYLESDPTVYSLAVIGQASNWVIAENKDLGDLAAANAFFELYTPTPQTANSTYYETGIMYSVLEPGTNARRYSITQNVLPGDVYLISRGDSPGYITENMSPNDTFWRNWFTNAGRPQIVDKIGQQYKETSIKWSNTFIPGTITNGLSSFDALDEKILPGELGPLRKLQITSKVNNEQGAVMLGICETETASMYLGETQLVGSAANAFVAQSTNVIGTVNILKGSFGTINPESVIEFRGNVFWLDVLNGKIIQYSLNGLFPISNYKMTRYWKSFCDQYNSMTREEIEALGSRPFVFTTVDPHHWELLISVPKLLEVPPLGYLPDMPDIVYPFDIWDGQAKTLVYKLNIEPNFWQGAYNFSVDGFVTVQNKLYSFKNGLLWQHNDTNSYGTIHDEYHKSRIMFVSNQVPSRPKVYNNVSVEANLLPTLTYFMSLQPFQQVSNLMDFDWENKEGILYSQIYRNVLTPSATGLVPNALVVGEKMRTYALRVMLEFSPDSTPMELRFVNLGYSISLGHKT